MRVLVVGDVIIDEYTHGNTLGVSAETPTIVAEQVKVNKFVGGAGLVVRNLLRLGCDVDLLTVSWYAAGEPSLRDTFRNCHDPVCDTEINKLNVIEINLPGWSITQKRRFFVGDYKLLQFDKINNGKWDKNRYSEFSSLSLGLMKNVDAVVICDNQHGVLSDGMGSEIVLNANIAGKECFVDSQVSQKKSNLYQYTNADYFFVNKKELYSYTLLGPDSSIKENMLFAKNKLKGNIILKLGDKGAATLADNDMLIIHKPHEVEVVDTCGAGDAFLASFVVNRDIMEANKWAALSTTYMGTVVPKR